VRFKSCLLLYIKHLTEMESTVGSAQRIPLSRENRSASCNAHLFIPAVPVVQKSNPGGTFGGQVL